MPRSNLKQAAQKRAASRVAEKIAKGSSKTTPNPSSHQKQSHPTLAANKTPVAVTNTPLPLPGLSGLSPDGVAAMLPHFHEDKYTISDPLNPPESLPQVTESQFNQAQSTYQGALRALKLTGMAFDVADNRFTVIGKRAKAFGSGVKAATVTERTKGDYLDYLSQVETTNQKAVNLDLNQAKTESDRLLANHTQTSLNERLAQAQIDAELARQKTAEKQNQLAEFKKSLGEYLPR